MSEYKDTAVFTMAALASSTILQPHDFEPATAERRSEVENCMHGVRKYLTKDRDIFEGGSSHIKLRSSPGKFILKL